MTLACTALIIAAFLNGINEGILWSDTEELWTDWPGGTGHIDLYHTLVRGGQVAGITVAVALGLGFNWMLLGALLLSFAFREISMDAVVGWNSSIASRGKGLALIRRVVRMRKQSLYGIPRFPLLERLAALILGGWLVGL